MVLGELAVAIVVPWLKRQFVPRRQRPFWKSKQSFGLLCLQSVAVLIEKVRVLTAC
jgi:hypothetical protein